MILSYEILYCGRLVMCVIYVINVSVCANYFWILYVGPGARLAVSLEGRGAQLWRHPGSNYLGYTSNGHLV